MRVCVRFVFAFLGLALPLQTAFASSGQNPSAVGQEVRRVLSADNRVWFEQPPSRTAKDGCAFGKSGFPPFDPQAIVKNPFLRPTP